jgi:hypothetical protein
MYEYSVCNSLYVLFLFFSNPCPLRSAKACRGTPGEAQIMANTTKIFIAATVSCKIRNLFAMFWSFRDVFHFLILLGGTSLLDFLLCLYCVLRIHYCECLISEMKIRMPHFSKSHLFDIIICSCTLRFLKFYLKVVTFVVDYVHSISLKTYKTSKRLATELLHIRFVHLFLGFDFGRSRIT